MEFVAATRDRAGRADDERAESDGDAGASGREKPGKNRRKVSAERR